MINDEIGKKLHDRSTRGEKLTTEEQQQLEDWYAYQDRLEMEAVQSTKKEGSLSDIQSQVDEALAQLVKLTDRIQKVVSENNQLREENSVLLNQLTKRFGRQAI